jgi:hypothetical protein
VPAISVELDIPYEHNVPPVGSLHLFTKFSDSAKRAQHHQLSGTHRTGDDLLPSHWM